MATTGDSEPGINGALFQRRSDSETTVTMSVDSIEEATASILAAGGKVIQDKTAIPSMGYFATCEDTEGNRFGLFTNDPNAS
jgi:predicted enzyme related to lactoylglutathione lyase